MRISSGRFFVLFVLVLIAVKAVSQGSIQGLIKDKQTGEPLIAATVMIDELKKGTASDMDGKYVITEVPPGKYTLKVHYVSYSDAVQQDVVVKSGEVIKLDFELSGVEIQLKGIQVVAVRRTNTEVSMLSSTKNAQLVVSGISSQQISRSLDTNAGEVVKRVPGVTVKDDRLIIIRGLNQRYNNVWLNSSAAPSSEADSRAFSFDLIPGGLIDNLLIYKNPAPEIPADFSGGFVKINTKSIPEENSINVGIVLGYDETSTFKNFTDVSRSAADYFGFGKSSRVLSSSFPGKLKSSMSVSEIAGYTNQINQGWETGQISALPDLRLSMTVNRKHQWGNVKAGSVTAINYSNTFRSYEIDNNRFGIYQQDIDKPFANNDYMDLQYVQDSKLGLLHNWSFILSPGSKIDFRNFFNQVGRNRYTYREGVEKGSENYTIRSREMFYMSRSIYSGQLNGAHDVFKSKGKLDWIAGYSFANRDEPDRKIISSRLQDDVESSGYNKYLTDANDVKRYYQSLEEHVGTLGINLSEKFESGIFQPEFKTGLLAELKYRFFDARNFAYVYNASVLPSDIVYKDYQDIFTSQNILSGGVTLKENTNKSDSYNAFNQLYAGYAGFNIPYLDVAKLYFGVRVEENILLLNGYQADGTRPVNINRSKLDIFPSINLTYNIDKRNLIRLAYGKSINRPEFREIAPYVYYDFEQFTEFVGNEDIKDAKIDNLDLRYEMYPTPLETFSVALFYKKFRNPIETTYISTSSGQKFTYRNAESANNYGVEVDLRKNLGFIGIEDLSVVANSSLIFSKVSFPEGSWERNRPMQGQSPYLINVGLHYDNEKSGINGNILYNRIGKRIAFLGIVYQDISQDIPDIYEMPVNSLDLVLSKSFGKKYELSLGVKNLLNETYEYKQFPKYKDANGDLLEREQVTRSWKQGRNVTVSFKAKI